MSVLEPLVALAAREIVRLSRRLSFTVGFDGLAPRASVTYRPLPSLAAIDERLAKIETARDGLQEALAAMDDLRITAQENRQDLENLNRAIERAEMNKADLQAQLDAARQLAAIDSSAVRAVLNIPSEVDKWKERIWGFLFGVLAAATVTLAGVGIEALSRTSPRIATVSNSPW